jgi:hypothetical protein
LSNVDVVGLESNPAEWLKKIKEIGLLEKFNNFNNNTNNNFYKDAFKMDVPNNRAYIGLISIDPEIINNLLYRNNQVGAEHEEETFVDLFIYKLGSKLNKPILNLEDFTTSLIMATKASTADPDEEIDESKPKFNYLEVMIQLNDAYRDGDLDLIDSLSHLMNASKNHQKYLIDDRNIIQAHSIDSIIKSGNSIFAGVGSAHLPGDAGIIELLKKMGYQIRPVSKIASKKGEKMKTKIEEIVKKYTPVKQFAADSLFTYELHNTPICIVQEKGGSFDLATDMSNGAFYSISRQTTYAGINNVSTDQMILKIDSLLYESVPGKIISKKNFTNVNGVKALDIINKTKQGDLQHYQIFFLENELIIFKMSAKNEYINGSDAMAFFESIRFNIKNTQDNFKFSPVTKGFEITIPPTYKYICTKRKGYQGLAENLYAYDIKTNMCKGVIQYYYNDFEYLEEDTFELNQLASSTLKNFGYETNTKRAL